GPYLLVEIDVKQLQQQRLAEISDEMAQRLRGATPTIRYIGRGVLDDAARIRLTDPADLPAARVALSPLAASVVFSEQETGVIEARLTEPSLRAMLGEAMPRASGVLQRRLDPSATIEPRGESQLVIRTRHMDWARAAATQVGALTFHTVRE